MELRLSTPGSLEVRVIDQQGAPLANVKLTVFGPEGELEERATDGSGTVRYQNVSPGMYWVTASAEGFQTGTAQAQVQANGSATATVRMSPGGEILGVVRGLSPPELERCRVTAGGPAGAAVSPSDGSFRLRGVPLGTVEVTARVFPLGQSKHVTVKGEEGIPAQVEIDFSQGITISGRVLRRGRTVAGVTVLAQGPSQFDAASDFTLEDGSFRLTGLTPGKWKLSVSDSQGQALASEEVTAQQDTQVVLQLPEGELRGWVRSRAGREGIEGATVRLAATQDQDFWRTTTTDEQGSFFFGELAPHITYRVRAEARGFSPAEAVVTAYPSSPTMELLLEPQKVLELWVRDADGTSPQEVILRLQGPSGKPELALVDLDREGKGVVTDLPAGQYVSLVQGQGVALVQLTVPSRITVQLQPPASLRLEAEGAGVLVRFFTADGLPVPLGWRGNLVENGWLPVQGTGRFSLPPGQYKLFSRRGETAKEHKLTLEPNQETTLTLSF